jgi:hypothetical protein
VPPTGLNADAVRRVANIGHKRMGLIQAARPVRDPRMRDDLEEEAAQRQVRHAIGLVTIDHRLQPLAVGRVIGRVLAVGAGQTLTSGRITGLFQQGRQRGRIVQVDARMQSAPGTRGESHRRPYLRRALASQHLAQGALNDRRHRLARVGRDLLHLHQQIAVQSNRHSHASKHRVRTSECRVLVPGRWVEDSAVVRTFRRVPLTGLQSTASAAPSGVEQAQGTGLHQSVRTSTGRSPVPAPQVQAGQGSAYCEPRGAGPRGHAADPPTLALCPVPGRTASEPALHRTRPGTLSGRWRAPSP